VRTRRHAVDQAQPAIGPVPVIRGARGDRVAQRPRGRGTGDRAPAAPVAVGHLPGVAAQRGRRRGRAMSDYRASIAQWKAEPAARRPKTPKLVANARLHEYVQARLAGQIQFPDGPRRRGLRRHGGKGGTKPWRQEAPEGRPRGVRSGSRTGSGATSPMMSPCASRARRSIRPSASRDAGHSSAGWSPACEHDDQ
jgi:hypothetical protein